MLTSKKYVDGKVDAIEKRLKTLCEEIGTPRYSLSDIGLWGCFPGVKSTPRDKSVHGRVNRLEDTLQRLCNYLGVRESTTQEKTVFKRVKKHT